MNQNNEFKYKHVYIENINPLIQFERQGFNNYKLHLPNFFDSRVYYISQYFLELFFHYSQNYTEQVINEAHTYYFYYRYLSYQSKDFSFYL